MKYSMFDVLRRKKAPDVSLSAEVQARLDALVAEVKAAAKERRLFDTKLADYETSAWFLAADSRLQVEAIHGALALLRTHASGWQGIRGVGHARWGIFQAAHALASRLLRKKHAYSEADLIALVDGSCGSFYEMPTRAVLTAVEKSLGESRPSEELRAALVRGRKSLGKNLDSAERKLAARIDALVAVKTSSGLELERVDAWTCAMQAELEAMPDATREAWGELLAHCVTARSARPSKKWLRDAGKAIEPIGADEFRAVWTRVLTAVGTKADFPVRVALAWPTGAMGNGEPEFVSERFSDCLRGLVWSGIPVENSETLAAVGDGAVRTFKKLAGHGPLAPKIGNACLYVLSVAESIEAVGQLSRLTTRVKHASVKRQIERSLERAAELHGMGADELEERGAPTCGMTQVGRLERTIGEFTAVVTVEGTRTVELRWRKPDGKLQKTVPATVKADFAGELADIKRNVNELKKLLPAQAQRIERCLLAPRQLPHSDWRERYLDHPLVGTVARRVLWSFGEGDTARVGAWHDGALVDVDGTLLELANDTPVVLWHPIDSPAETVQAWREWLHTRGVTQPFKQAHREIYLLTDAERQTETYSNRFAAHVLKQHQFSALCQDRGWRYSLMGAFDSHNTPTRDLTDEAIRVEFWVDFIETDADTSDSGIYLYIATDQVRFYRMHGDGPMPLAEVPPRIFSELMRDVDLFVGVASVANDPTWVDGGPEGRYRDYWQGFAFGKLTESAKTRREVLERVVPQLKIADRCSFEERFLVVRGDLRTYRIHLGSGNIQMSPNNEYLCIVPGRGKGTAGNAVALPFEGDSTLSIILSKAFMLADDKKIKDSTIVSQLRLR